MKDEEALQKRVNLAELRLLSLEGPVCNLALGWHLEIWILEVSPGFNR